jgi:hypothetical protein
MAIHITIVRQAKQSPLRQSIQQDKHLAIINRFSACNTTITSSHNLKIFLLGIHSLPPSPQTPAVLSFLQ